MPRLTIAASEPSRFDHMDKTYLDILRLNIKTSTVLMLALQPDLDRFLNQPSQATTSSQLERLTPVMHRILPAFRLQSAWLVKFAIMLSGRMRSDKLLEQLQKSGAEALWLTYAGLLTTLVRVYSVSDLPAGIDYLLEEDEDTLGFWPFQVMEEETIRARYLDETTGELKRRSHMSGIQRNHPNYEMLGRIRDIVVDGVHIANMEVSISSKHILQLF